MPDAGQQLRRPTREEIRDLAAEQFLTLTDEELDEFEAVLDGTMAFYERLEQYDDPRHGETYDDRTIGPRPDETEDPLNAVISFCGIEGEEDGPLAGYDVGLKDNVAVAGLPMTCGSRVLDDHVASWDATVVRRLLDAGADVTAKLNMEPFAISASGEQSLGGAVRNPHDDRHLAGGSSSGAGAAVASGIVDVAIGTDSGGSIRIPADWTGCVGLKPTHGLVPETGVVGMCPTMDHVGPIARSAEDCALALDAIAGDDPRDPRGRDLETDQYVGSLATDCSDLTVGVLQEGFGVDASDERVDETVRAGAEAFEATGASVTEVSIPWHADAPDVHKGIVIESLTAFWETESVGRFTRRQYDVELAAALGKARRAMADDLPPALRVNLVAGSYLTERYHGRYHAKAQNLAHELAAAYDEALESVDLLALPTTPILPLEHETDLTSADLIRRGRMMLDNTTPFDVTGHPAASIPCGTVDGLPVGMQVVGPEFSEATILRAAHAYETVVDPESP
jgi:amidase